MLYWAAIRSHTRINLEVHGGGQNISLGNLAGCCSVNLKDEGTQRPNQLVGVKILGGVAGVSSATVIVGVTVDMYLLIDAVKIAVQYFGDINFLTVAVIIRAGRVACLT